jgi:hypothetical protein
MPTMPWFWGGRLDVHKPALPPKVSYITGSRGDGQFDRVNFRS